MTQLPDDGIERDPNPTTPRRHRQGRMAEGETNTPRRQNTPRHRRPREEQAFHPATPTARHQRSRSPSPESNSSPSIMRLHGYVRASLNIDVSRFVPGTPTRHTRSGRPVVVVSEEPVEVEDSSPESLGHRGEPTTPTQPSRQPAQPTDLARSPPPDVLAQSLSYTEGSYRRPRPDGPNALFSRLDRECSPSPPPTPNPSRSPSPELAPGYSKGRMAESPTQDLDPFVCPSPAAFGVSPHATRPHNPTPATNELPPRTPRRYRSTGARSLYPALPVSPTPARVNKPSTMPPTPGSSSSALPPRALPPRLLLIVILRH
ncbi:hypothetical protein BC629DRAFT_1592685 [Irpex lacteus]|nr:hypothetical protein BC629DRAFT_1592685 [Irpex lacteus]